MEKIDRNELKNRLIELGYIPEFGLERTIDNLLNLQNLENKSAYELLVDWMDTGKVRDFESIEGIDKKYLKSTLKMKDPAIILAYGMLLYDPKRNVPILKNEARRRMGFQPMNINK